MADKDPIVLQLQGLAMDPTTAVPELLRRALAIAVKLKLDDVETWINLELHGYRIATDLPPYRRLGSRLRAWNPINGWIPVTTSSPQVQEILERVPLAQSVDHLADLLSQDGDAFDMPFTAHQEAALRKIGWKPMFQVFRSLSRGQIAAVLAEVRNRILTWALELERQGIVGQGLSFSTVERQKAAMTASIHIGGNFQGILGDVSGSTVHQQLTMTFGEGDIQGLRGYLQSQGLDDAALVELEVAVREDPKPSTSGAFGEKVSAWMGRMLQRAASGGWEVGIGAAGGMLASALGRYYGLPGS